VQLIREAIETAATDPSGANPMSMATLRRPPSPTLLPLRRITVDEYERIVEAGALEDPSRVELIDGYLVTKMGKNAAHRFTTKEALKALDNRLPPGWTSQKEEPVRIPDHDEPEPDIAIIRGSDADYRRRIPTAADVALVVEVSGRTLIRDRGKKRLAYAQGGIPVYWIINLIKGQVEVYSDPARGRYPKPQIFKRGRKVPVVICGQQCGEIAVDDILP
jgi:Uma2 family endonuclease